MFSSRRSVRLSEPLKDVRHKLRRDAFAGIADHDFEILVLRFQLDFNTAIPGSELDGIREQVPDHLLQTHGFPNDQPAIALNRGNDLDLLGHSSGTNGIDRGVDYCRRIDRLWIELEFTRDDA